MPPSRGSPCCHAPRTVFIRTGATQGGSEAAHHKGPGTARVAVVAPTGWSPSGSRRTINHQRGRSVGKGGARVAAEPPVAIAERAARRRRREAKATAEIASWMDHRHDASPDDYSTAGSGALVRPAPRPRRASTRSIRSSSGWNRSGMPARGGARTRSRSTSSPATVRRARRGPSPRRTGRLRGRA
jgi:hypothetical protein